MLGDSRKAIKELNWKPKRNIQKLIKEMVNFRIKFDIIMINFKSKIYVAGHRGLVGSAIIRKLKKKGYKNIIYKERRNLI